MFIIVAILQLFSLVLFARVITSFVPIDPGHPAIRFLYDVTEPVLEPVRRLLPQTGMIDFSPLVVFFGIQVLTGILT
ncbi:YggT family protein [Chloroflexi bacterium TSY]|nr:YggT family protein [Chloroflexi bacterium TSY]